MPNTWRWLWQGGRTYPNFSISDPLCCPSRMTIMTGRYAHNTGVIDNLSSRISFHPDMQSTVQCYLKDAGYRTAFFGKYLNGWDFTAGRRAPTGTRSRPASATTGCGSAPTTARSQPHGWDDTYVTGHALDFLQTQTGDGPWFMTVSLMSPHSPYTPLPAVADAPVPPPHDQPGGGSVRPLRPVPASFAGTPRCRRTTRGSGTARSGCSGRSTRRWSRSGRRSRRPGDARQHARHLHVRQRPAARRAPARRKAAAVSRGDGRAVRGLRPRA